VSIVLDFTPKVHKFYLIHFQPIVADLDRFSIRPNFMFREKLNTMIIANVILVSSVHYYCCYLNILKKIKFVWKN